METGRRTFNAGVATQPGCLGKKLRFGGAADLPPSLSTIQCRVELEQAEGSLEVNMREE